MGSSRRLPANYPPVGNNIKKMAKTDENTKDEIIVNDPQVIRPVDLPLVVELPDGASESQQAFAKVINAYAYQNPAKWAIKKDKLVNQLKALKDVPLVEEDGVAKVTRK